MIKMLYYQDRRRGEIMAYAISGKIVGTYRPKRHD
jgi:hypothetical protein